MSASFRHRWHQILRTGLMLVVALSLIAQPMLNALGEMHELAAHADSASRHDAHYQPHVLGATTQVDDHDAGSPMHALLHYAHCCGHLIGLAGIEPSLPGAHWPHAQPTDTVAYVIASARVTTPFRPPITA